MTQIQEIHKTLNRLRDMPRDHAKAMARREINLAVIIAGWGTRSGWPKLPDDLPVRRCMLPTGDVLQHWQSRVDHFTALGAIREIAEWSAYLQWVDSQVDALIESHQPYLAKLEHRRHLEEAIREEVIGTEVDVWKRELLELEAWIDANVPA